MRYQSPEAKVKVNIIRDQAKLILQSSKDLWRIKLANYILMKIHIL